MSPKRTDLDQSKGKSIFISKKTTALKRPNQYLSKTGLPQPFFKNKPMMGGKVNQFLVRNLKNNFLGLEIKKA